MPIRYWFIYRFNHFRRVNMLLQVKSHVGVCMLKLIHRFLKNEPLDLSKHAVLLEHAQTLPAVYNTCLYVTDLYTDLITFWWWWMTTLMEIGNLLLWRHQKLCRVGLKSLYFRAVYNMFSNTLKHFMAKSFLSVSALGLKSGLTQIIESKKNYKSWPLPIAVWTKNRKNILLILDC